MKCQQNWKTSRKFLPNIENIKFVMQYWTPYKEELLKKVPYVKKLQWHTTSN